MLSMFLVIGYSSSTATYCAFVVGEKEQKLKYVLNVMGCHSITYWLGTFCFDYLAFLCTLVIKIFFFLNKI